MQSVPLTTRPVNDLAGQCSICLGPSRFRRPRRDRLTGDAGFGESDGAVDHRVVDDVAEHLDEEQLAVYDLLMRPAPDLTDAEISLQIEYGLKKGYAWSVEYTDDPHPRNTYWEMFGMPMFDLKDAAGVMMELQGCRRYPLLVQHYALHRFLQQCAFHLRCLNGQLFQFAHQQQQNRQDGCFLKFQPVKR